MFDTVLLMLHAGGGVSAKPRKKAPALSRASLRRLGRAYKRRKGKGRSGGASGKRNSWSGFRG